MGDQFTHYTACGLMILIINLMFGLTYFDLTKNEHLVNMNKDLQISTFVKDSSIPNFSRPIMLTALSYRRITGSEDNVKSVANI